MPGHVTVAAGSSSSILVNRLSPSQNRTGSGKDTRLDRCIWICNTLRANAVELESLHWQPVRGPPSRDQAH
eukprot:1253967-Rhodomonas_salina.3